MTNGARAGAGQLLADRRWEGLLFSEGWREAEGGSYPLCEPATGEFLATVGLATPADVGRATAAAAAVQREWAGADPEARGAMFLRAAQLVDDHRAEIAEWIVRETGSVPGKAQVELDAAVGELREAAALTTQPRGVVLAAPEGQTSVAHRVPMGVVAVITPWNMPLLLAMRSVAPALGVGNCVVLKPDAKTAVAGGFVLARLFEEAGLPPGVLHVLPGGPEVGEALVGDPAVAMVSFTGSSAAGRRVAEVAGRGLKRVSLELGGNNAYIVLDDADLDSASAVGAWSSYLHQGQLCLAAGRHLVHRDVAAAYVERLVARAEGLTVGDPYRDDVGLGPIINTRQLERVTGIVERSVSAGAVVRAGGTHEDLFFRPTVLDAVTPGMPAFDEEIFGPVAPVTVFDDDNDAVALANQTEYGLVAAIQSGSVARASAIADRLRTGMVHVNDTTVNDLAHVPFGGVGASGNGARYGSVASWETFTQWRWMTTRPTAPTYW